MGQDSRDEQVRLTFEIEDEEKRLRDLRDSAHRMGSEFIRLGTIVRDHPNRLFRHGMSAHHKHDMDEMEVIDDSTWRVFDLKGPVELANEIRESMTRIDSLKRRLARLA